MNRIIIIFLLFLSVLSSCVEQKNENKSITNKTEDSATLKLIKTYYFDEDSVALLEVLRDKNKNYILLQTKLHERLLSIAGIGNIDFLDGELRLDTLFFEKGKKVFVLPTHINGSTYGAVVYFLIYEDGYPHNWEITRIPFDRLEIKTNDDRISTILQYTSDNEYIKYTFKEGFFQQVE